MEEINILDRAAKTLGVSSDADLARVLGISAQSLSNMRKRGTVPYEKIVSIAAKKGLSLDYLLLGKSLGEIDKSLFNRIIEAVQAPDSELREMRLEDLIDEILTMYNSVIGLPSDEQQKWIGRQVLIMSNMIIKRSIANTEDFARSIGTQDAMDSLRSHHLALKTHIFEIEKKLFELGVASEEGEQRSEEDAN